MKIIKASAGLLTNFEVLEFLRNKGKSTIKDEKNSEIRNSDTEVGQNNESDIMKLRLTPSELKVYDYLINTAARDQTRECVSEFLRSCKKYELAQADILPLLNLRPSEPTAAVELFSMVESFYQRYENEETELIQIIDEVFSSSREEVFPSSRQHLVEEVFPSFRS